MAHRTKKVISIFLIIIVGSVFFLQYKFKSEVIEVINTKLPSTIALKYSKINTSILTGTVELNRISAKLLNSEKTVISILKADNIKISGFSLWQFIFNKTIAVDDLIFENPNLHYYKSPQKQTQSKDSTANQKFDKTITIDKIMFINGTLKTYENNAENLVSSIDSINFTLNELSTNSKKLKNKTPFNYKDYQLNAKRLFFNMSKFEVLKIENLNLENHRLSLTNLFITPKFTKEELTTKITKERDFIELHIPEVILSEFDVDFKNKKLYVTSDTSKIIKPNLIVYRDKRVADDNSIKKMYSKMLRDLKFHLAISTMEINQGYINYSERIEDTNEAGEIFFDKVNAHITNLSNTYTKGEKMKILINSHFMGKAPMGLDISFDVNNAQNNFLVSGQFKNLNTKIVNSFFESNLNAKSTGEIEQLYFTFKGTDFNSTGDFKMKYEDFRFEILNKKDNVNKFLTTIGNLFVNDGSKTDEDGYRHGTIKVDRNQTKSFFNYLWLNVQDGLISTLTGNGEKK